MTYASRDQFIGRVLNDRYRVRSRIARGGMGVVYLADDLRLDRQVALKIMHPHLVDDESFVRRFRKEAHAAAKLADPHVVNVFDQGFDGAIPYLVMEYVPGITLRQLLKQQGKLTSEQSIQISEAVLSGLAAAHSSGFIHRDVKPENVFLADDGRIKIGDFGLARPASANTTTGQGLFGTIAYLSPELVTRGIADARSDIYAFGIMLYEMLTGEQPFQGEQAVQIAYMHANQDVPAPSLVSSEADERLDAVVHLMTARNPAHRPRDGGQALRAMHRLLEGENLAGISEHAEDASAHDDVQRTKMLDRTQLLQTGQGVGADETTAYYGALVGNGGEANTPTTLLAGGGGFGQAGSGFAAATPVIVTESVDSLASVQAVQHSRRRAGRLSRFLVTLAVFAALAGAAVGWWFTQGPGSQISVPELANLPAAEAQATLEKLRFQVVVDECNSVTVETGRVVSSEPVAGTRLDPESTVHICRSIGPRILAVPQLVGLSFEEAKRTIEEHDFRFGKVLDRRYSQHEVDTVIGALDEQQNPLGDELAEQSTINLVVSAGPLPDVSGINVDDAIAALKRAELTVDANREEVYDDTVPAGRVLSLIASDNVHPGGTVGLRVSRGPELFEVPDVVGKRMKEAIQILQNAGFDPKTNVPELLQNAVRVNGTDPAAGTKVKRGTAVTLFFEL